MLTGEQGKQISKVPDPSVLAFSQHHIWESQRTGRRGWCLVIILGLGPHSADSVASPCTKAARHGADLHTALAIWGLLRFHVNFRGFLLFLYHWYFEGLHYICNLLRIVFLFLCLCVSVWIISAVLHIHAFLAVSSGLISLLTEFLICDAVFFVSSIFMWMYVYVPSLSWKFSSVHTVVHLFHWKRWSIL